jgi:DNA-binding SARP family transcriptional activator
MRYEVLGPVSAWCEGTQLNLGPSQRRVILSVLLLHANRPLGREQFIGAVWGEGAPTYAANLLQKHISALRRALEPDRPGRAPSEVLTWTDSGYLLPVPVGDLDLQDYESRVARARAALGGGDVQKAAKDLHQALDLWRGEAFGGLSSPLLDAQRHRLAEQRIDIIEERINLDLTLGVESDLVTELRQLVTDHPQRDRLSALLMLALYRGGRRVDALAVFHDVRRRLHDEFGIDPSAHLQTLHQQILAGNPAIDQPRVPSTATTIARSESGREDRKRSRKGPIRINVSVPHPARMHDYWLGGRHNFVADRELADEIMTIMPGLEDVARVNQSFVRRATLFMVASGIRQFIDLGSGLPTVRYLHETIQQADPGCRIAYVECDPVAVAHCALLFEPVTGIAIVQANIHDATEVFDAEAIRSLLDLARPIGLIMPMLHFIPDSWSPADLVASYLDRLAPGSYLVLAHLSAESTLPGLAEVVKAYGRTHYPVVPRSRARVMQMCAGLELVAPGLVGLAHWRPEKPSDASSNPAINSLVYAAVGRKP